MLILTRKKGESIMIGNDIVVTILGITGGMIRIGVVAPREVAVHRDEVFERIQKEGSSREAAKTGRVSGNEQHRANVPKNLNDVD